jgi:hypothetical protein
MLTQGQIEAFDEGGVDGPAVLSQLGLDRFELTPNQTVLDADQTPS